MIRVRVEASVPARVAVVRAERLSPGAYPPGFEDRLSGAVAARRAALGDVDERTRLRVRDMLRHGSYKPTGRAKPASEYLLRSVSDEAFPRINPPVDVCNLISLETLFPISLWDLERAAAERYVVRHGREEEGYVFNAGGQVIGLRDLLVGCRVLPDGADEPIVNPVKDSLATKTAPQTTRVAALVYVPLEVAGADEAARSFADLLAGCGSSADSTWSVVEPGGEAEV